MVLGGRWQRLLPLLGVLLLFPMGFLLARYGINVPCSLAPWGCKTALPPSTPPSPLLHTFMYTARNDDYGENPVQRLNASLTLLLWGLSAYRVGPAEVVITDWASDVPLAQSATMRSLAAAMPLCRGSGGRAAESAAPSCRTTPMRFLYVPTKVAFNLTASNNSLSEVHALNAAARRSRGRMLFHMDQDTLLGLPFFELLESLAANDPNNLFNLSWFTTRRLTGPEERPAILTDPVAFIRNISCDAHPIDGALNVENGDGATGIFAVPRTSWVQSRGFSEAMTQWGHMHREFIPRIKKFLHPTVDISQHMREQFAFYHTYHIHQWQKRGFNTMPDDRFDPPSIARNGPDWGLAGQHLHETVV